jgi:hypothetical protein
VASPGNYATCLAFNPSDLCIAVGTSNKLIKYWELTDYTLVSSSYMENYTPRALCFEQSGDCAHVGMDDCTKSYNLDFDGAN